VIVTFCDSKKGGPLLEQIKGAIEAAQVQALPSSALAKGCNYTLTRMALR
jgi:hypothetical protein